MKPSCGIELVHICHGGNFLTDTALRRAHLLRLLQSGAVFRQQPVAQSASSAAALSRATSTESKRQDLLCWNHCRPKRRLRTKPVSSLIYSVGIIRSPNKIIFMVANYNCKIQHERRILDIPNIKNQLVKSGNDPSPLTCAQPVMPGRINKRAAYSGD